MENYRQLRERQQQEFNALPIKFAFNKQQFAEGMAALGLAPEDEDKIYTLGSGSFYRRSDAELIAGTMKRHDRELAEAFAADATGEGFIYSAMLYELDNHEYGYTGDPEDALAALGYTLEEVAGDARLYAGFKKAKKEIYSREDY